jgi:hypothetical protein
LGAVSGLAGKVGLLIANNDALIGSCARAVQGERTASIRIKTRELCHVLTSTLIGAAFASLEQFLSSLGWRF